MKLAPIILFVYNRAAHTRKVLEALFLNDLAKESTLYIYSDGPKENATNEELEKIQEVRNVIKEKQWCKEVHIVEHKTNYGLASNIIKGVTEIIEKDGNIIVLEDDIVTSKGFLKYMNDALSFYKNEDRVMHISGYMYPHKDQLPETFFFNVPLCWGWATWKESWTNFNKDSVYLWNEIKNRNLVYELDKFGGDYLSSQLAHNITGKLNTWFIKWHTSVLLNNGLTLYPKQSLVDNIGFDSTGVHKGKDKKFKNPILADNIKIEKVDIIENEKAKELVKAFYKEKLNLSKKKYKEKLKVKLRSLFFKVFPDVKNTIQNIPKVNLNKTYIGNHCKIYPLARIKNSLIGNYTYIAENSVISNTIIGKFCSIGPNLMSGWGYHPTNGISTHPMFYSTRKQNGMTLSKEDKLQESLPITIGNDVFVGMNVTILDGVSIGDGAVIGAGALVSKDIPPYAIAVGNPIKIINYRFKDEIINEMLKVNWWNLNEDKLSEIEKHFFDVEKYLSYFERKK
ncbi:hypothetical protein A8C32_00765 [Flavivirga aquatica]|uniref:Uncharacterized protein n=1 Tax=Flavivirga aquatica TaxID=1849968 RepID=A0A1E5TBV9_9FLAO|nr:DapH/DapD/GlmU-related protein [Flavivirga aquatica]OEK08840.1 hypothetical protein A8C32_00765 [Flavivirga aquatica]